MNNSYELCSSLSGRRMGSSDILVSLDVTSLFSNIPLDLAIGGISDRWIFIEQNTNIPKNEFITAIKFVLTSTFFTFNNLIYRQTFGTPMGSPLSPIIADVVMQDLEEKVLSSLIAKPLFYYRYVDDILLAAHVEQINSILNSFNDYHERLKFTIEYESDRCLSFLDLSLNIINNSIYIDWFHKKTFSGRFLSFYSKHPLCHKIGTIYNLVDRAILLSHPRFQQKNLEICIDLLLNNGYPLGLIFNKINVRLKKLINNKFKCTHEEIPRDHTIATDESNNKKKFLTFPYIKNISEITASIVDRNEFMIGYRCLNKLGTFVKAHKDKNHQTSNNNVIYKIYCKDCDASYVGQTKRQLKTRLKEHMNNFKLDQSKHSVITEHMLNFNHSFNWDNVKILDSECNFHKRLISEMLHIKEQKNGINSNKDTEMLDCAYFNILDELTKNNL